jgi:hypothetical protein
MPLYRCARRIAMSLRGSGHCNPGGDYVFGIKRPGLVTVVLVATGILLVLLLYIGVASGIWRHLR